MSAPSAAATPALVIDASTYRATVALVQELSVLSHTVVAMRGEREERLMPAVAQVLEAGGVKASQLSWVICGSGPGSFTSLRIAAAIAKGLCSAPRGAGAQGERVGVKAPRLGAVSSLALIVAGAIKRLPDGLYLASLDAMRGERYAALIELGTATSMIRQVGERQIHWDGSWDRASRADLIERARRASAAMIGPDDEPPTWPDAAGLVHLWGEVVEADPASWEPDYGRLAEAEVRRDARSSGA